MSVGIVVVLVTGIALGLLMHATISIRWGSPVPLGLPLLIGVADVFTPMHVVSAFLVAGAVIILLPHPVQDGHTGLWFIARCVGAASISALWWALGTHTATANLTLIQTVRALSIAAPVFGVDLAREKLRYRRLDASVVRKLGATYLSVFLSELLLALAVRGRDVNLGVLPAIIAAVLWYGSKTVVKNQQTVAEATATMGTFPELTKFSTVGHSQRMVLLARAIGEQARFGPTHIEYLARGAAVARIGYIAYPDVDAIHEGYEIPSREDVADHAAQILTKANFLNDVRPLVDGFLRADALTLNLDHAILRVAANFDDLTASVGEVDDDQALVAFAMARTRELAGNKLEQQAIRLLEDAFEANPMLMDNLRHAGQMREDIRAEIETRMAGRGSHDRG